MNPAAEYQRIEEALHFLVEHREQHPDLRQAAASAGLSPSQFHRRFRKWVGVSPKRFIQYITLVDARRRLRASETVLDATYGSGLSSPSRLHDLFVSIDAVTPGEFKAKGRGLTIRYGCARSPFGNVLIGTSERGVCWLSFHDDSPTRNAIAELEHHWSGARFVYSEAAARGLRDRIFTREASGLRPALSLLVRGTNFQLKVWEALLRVPSGALCSYGELASNIGCPRAQRATGSAVAANAVAYLIPCHRVVRSLGQLGDYRWGARRKALLIGWEGVNASNRADEEQPPEAP